MSQHQHFISIQFERKSSKARWESLQCNYPLAFCIHCLLLFIEAKLPRCEKAGEKGGGCGQWDHIPKAWWLQKPQKLINCSSPKKVPGDDELIKAELKFQGVCKRTGIFFSSLKQYFIQSGQTVPPRVSWPPTSSCWWAAPRHCGTASLSARRAAGCTATDGRGTGKKHSRPTQVVSGGKL